MFCLRYWKNVVGIEKRVRIIHGKRDIRVRAIEVILYINLLNLSWITKCLFLMTMEPLIKRVVLLFVCSKMADEINLSSKLPVAEGTREDLRKLQVINPCRSNLLKPCRFWEHSTSNAFYRRIQLHLFRKINHDNEQVSYIITYRLAT